MKLLNGAELAGYIKERQAHSVRVLKQNSKTTPKLAIIRTNPDPIVDSYMRLKQNYGEEVGVEVEVFSIEQSEASDLIEKLNADQNIHGIIVQIPLPDPSQTDEILNLVSPNKDVDGLSIKTAFDPATPMAINWLLSGYNIELKGREILIVGQGRLVGNPLAKIWMQSGLDVKTANKATEDLANLVKNADILVCATGVAGLITQEMVHSGQIIVDAGVATDSNGLVGDVAESVRQLDDITITPVKGGVGPLTVSALFENVINSASKTVRN